MAEVHNLYDAVIIGGGPAGLTAAIYLARARYRVLVVERDHFGGQITITSEIVNYPGVLKTSGTELTHTMYNQAERFGAEFMLADVTGLELDDDVKTVHTSQGDISCLAVLLATGSNPRLAGFTGEEEFRGHGVAYCATCDGEFFEGKDVFVIGGGFAAAEESVFLTKYARHVYVLIRRETFSCAAAVYEETVNNPKITVIPFSVVDEVGGDTALRYLKYRNTQTGEVTEYRPDDGDTFGVFVFAGYTPVTDLVKGIAELDKSGYVVTDEHCATTAPGLYAAGDVCIKSLRQVVTAAGEAALAATEMERYLSAAHDKTGLIPTPPVSVKPSAASSDMGDVEPREAEDAAEEGGLFTPDMIAQLNAVFDRMAEPLTLRMVLDDRPVSADLREYMDELSALTSKLSVEVVPADDISSTLAGEDPDGTRMLTPYVSICRADGTPTGMAFHGVPGGHEFTSFVLGLYNAAGPGQPLDDASRTAIEAIDHPIELQVLVSLTCTMCPDTVQAVERIAALNPLVTADIYDLAHFPELRDRYNVMSVPCLVIDAGAQVSFGKKQLPQVLDIIG